MKCVCFFVPSFRLYHVSSNNFNWNVFLLKNCLFVVQVAYHFKVCIIQSEMKIWFMSGTNCFPFANEMKNVLWFYFHWQKKWIRRWKKKKHQREFTLAKQNFFQFVDALSLAIFRKKSAYKFSGSFQAIFLLLLPKKKKRICKS